MLRLFGTDGIRGVAGDDLTCELAMQVGEALCNILSESGRYRPTILIGRDTRQSSPMLAAALAAGICSRGGDAVFVGVCSTPAVAFLVRKHSASAGVMISASHNPYQYNGIKIFASDGFKLSDELEGRIEDMIFTPSKQKSGGQIGKISNLEGAESEYIDYLKNSFGISLRGIKVGIDCANGSAATTARALFEALGADCYMLGDVPNGENINLNCGSTCLEGLKSLVRREKLDLGIAFDGDADRCLAVDSQGREIDGDFIMAILALDLKKDGKLKKNTVVGTVATNMGFLKFCEENGISYISSKVGDRYVLEMLNQEGYSLGGEQSGHIILRDLATTGDGQLTAVALLCCIKKSGKSLLELSSVMKKYPQITINIQADKDAKLAFLVDSEIKDILDAASKKIGANGRLLARPSGTEPLIRIMAEGEDEKLITEILRDTTEKIKMRLLEIASN